MCKSDQPKHDTAGCTEYHQVSRRGFLGWAGGALTALAVPTWMPRVVMADSENSSRDVIISIFLRGGADGLTLCVPHAEDAYYGLRPNLAVARPDSSAALKVTDLDGFFGLPPAMAPLLGAYQAGDLAVVHACGLPQTSRSHFDAMHFMETGQVSPGNLATGWLGRHLQNTAPTHAEGLLRAVAIGFGLPRHFVGAPQSLPIDDLTNFNLRGAPNTLADRRQALETMYGDLPGVLGESARNTFQTVDLLDQIDFEGYQAAGGAVYPESELGQSLQSTAALLKAELGVEAVGIDVGGWDTHDFQGSTEGEMATLMSDLAQGLAAFHQDMHGAPCSYTLVAMSEFGRNAFENGSLGTDHGHGGVLFAMGDSIDGGQVMHDWPGLSPNQLYEGQDLAITIDYRDILAEILTQRLDNADIDAVFGDPSFTPQMRGIVKA